MKTEARLFIGVAVFLWLVAIFYGVWTAQPNSFSHGKLEWAGTIALILSGGLTGLAGSFFWFVSRRIDPRPEDLGDAEIAEGAGELGFFSPGSYWPFGLGIAVTVAGTGLAFVQWWLVIVALLLLLFMVGGLVFEYYIGGHHPISR
jgi:hypothetical protein